MSAEKKERNDLVVAMYKTGDMSAQYIADSLDLSKSTVKVILRHRGVKVRHQGCSYPRDFEHVYARYYATGECLTDYGPKSRAVELQQAHRP